jgi:hypothetical protein
MSNQINLNVPNQDNSQENNLNALANPNYSDSNKISTQIVNGLQDMKILYNLLPDLLEKIQTLLDCSPDLVNNKEIEAPWKKLMSYVRENLKFTMEFNKKLTMFRISYNMLMVHLSNFYRNCKQNEDKLPPIDLVKIFSSEYLNSLKNFEEGLQAYEEANKLDLSYNEKDVTSCLTELVQKVSQQVAVQYEKDLQDKKILVEKKRQELHTTIIKHVNDDKNEQLKIAEAHAFVEASKQKILLLNDQKVRNDTKIKSLKEEQINNEKLKNSSINEIKNRINERIEKLENNLSTLYSEKQNKNCNIDNNYNNFIQQSDTQHSNLLHKLSQVKDAEITTTNSSNFLFWSNSRKDIEYIDTGERGHINTAIKSLEESKESRQKIKHTLQEQNNQFYNSQISILNNEIQSARSISQSEVNSQNEYFDKLKNLIDNQIKEIESDNKKIDIEICEATEKETKYFEVIPGLEESFKKIKTANSSLTSLLQDDLNKEINNLLNMETNIENALKASGAVNCAHLHSLTNSITRIQVFILGGSKTKNEGNIFLESFRNQLNNWKTDLSLISSYSELDLSTLRNFLVQDKIPTIILKAFDNFCETIGYDVLLDWALKDLDSEDVIQVLKDDPIKLNNLQVKSFKTSLIKAVKNHEKNNLNEKSRKIKLDAFFSNITTILNVQLNPQNEKRDIELPD